MRQSELKAAIKTIFRRIARIETQLRIDQSERRSLDEGERRNRELLFAAQSGDFDDNRI